ncbi:MAG: LemA family protein [Kiritimatiellae bacterium]|jgi:LemA protein|nr:LemA family protein [Kiritimatiellia bacterium]
MNTLIVVGIIVVALVALVGWVVGLYNGLVVLKNRFKNAFAQIDVQLRRRYDLIPNLVETAKGYLKHERETLTAVIEARNQAAGAAKALAAAPGDPSAVKAFASAESGLAGLLSRLMVVVERYPELKADAQMSRVMEELSSTENRIAFARQAYNDAVTEYNTKRELFPTSIVAGMFNFDPAALLESTDSAAQREAPQVKF